jgi:hypothetical protein
MQQIYARSLPQLCIDPSSEAPGLTQRRCRCCGFMVPAVDQYYVLVVLALLLQTAADDCTRLEMVVSRMLDRAQNTRT